MVGFGSAAGTAKRILMLVSSLLTGANPDFSSCFSPVGWLLFLADELAWAI